MVKLDKTSLTQRLFDVQKKINAAYVSIRQHTSAYVSIRQHTSAYVSIRQHTSASLTQRLLNVQRQPPSLPLSCAYVILSIPHLRAHTWPYEDRYIAACGR